MARFGRRHAPDPRDRAFLLAPRVAAAVASVAPSKHWPLFIKPLDQSTAYCRDPDGNCGTCVGWGTKHALMAAPIVHRRYDQVPSPLEIYLEATKLDEWPDNDGDIAAGTSVRAGMKALQSFGLLDRYEWEYAVDGAISWLCGMDAAGAFVGGPLVGGFNWYESMFDPDGRGIVRIAPSSPVAGGHCFAILGYNAAHDLFSAVNSWGMRWGRSGRFLLPSDVLKRLLSEDGELAALAEIRLPAAS